MKAVILAGGTQSTINNEYEGIPKPMIEVGGRPLLWHIMKHFFRYGINDFIICGGYRIDLIKAYFMDYYIYQSDITVNLAENVIEIHKKKTEDWKVTVVDTGLYSSTAKRISLIKDYIDEDMFLTIYGDCLSDINISELISVHTREKKTATMVVAKPSGRNKLLSINNSGQICDGNEQDMNEHAWVNANCFLFNKDIFQYLREEIELEDEFVFSLAEKQLLGTYQHRGFWSTIETRRDLMKAEHMWKTRTAPWIKFKTKEFV